ncbi:MAG: 6-bladed beta-propeller [Gammaproteobacteria bacterium]|nr:6-bladed beta-propeller [Gammaproteobacteria bacterium]
MHSFIIASSITALLGLVLLSGCASTEYRMEYEVDPASAQVWPQPPEVPRYRYVGEITGQRNVIEVDEGKGFGAKIADFFKWMVGMKGPSPVPVVLQRPQTGAVDNEGRIFVTDVSRHAVFVFDVNKGMLSEWVRASPQENFITPVGIGIDKNNSIYVVDADLRYVAKLDKDGNPIAKFGGNLLKRPTGLALDQQAGKIYVADTHAHDIKVFNIDGDLIDVLGQRGTDIGEFNSPTHLAFMHGNLYITDTFNTRVQVLTPSGQFSQQFGERGVYVGNLVRPKGVTSDSEGNVYVIESLHDHLLIYNSKGEFLLPVGGTGTEVGQFYLPSGIWTDNQDRIYIADMFNGRIVILQYLGDKHVSHSILKN